MLQIIGTAVFDRFETETPIWKKVLRWTVAAVGTVVLFRFIGHWALLFPGGFALLGGVVHFSWCRRHGIDPWRATPRRKYFALRGWTWPEE